MATAKKKENLEGNAHADAGLTKKQVQTLFDALLAEKERLVEGAERHVQEATQERSDVGDEADLASIASEQAYLLRLADKERKLLAQIERALQRMKDGEYGICMGTGEPIGYKRLEIRPWTSYSVAYKEELERERRHRA